MTSLLRLQIFAELFLEEWSTWNSIQTFELPSQK